ncbi:metallothionein family protein [Pseudomonas sp. NPDC088368]|uniref:metallothionein family protein n=1 Tax=Pseudomonas sp. NPDC088368 TaxID=3364453 RepID=UPI00381B70B1
MDSRDQLGKCACTDCKCMASAVENFRRDGKGYCSQACADLHPAGARCSDETCHCDQITATQNRSISESQLDQAVEESFPASDPISP